MAGPGNGILESCFTGPWPQVLHEVLEFVRLQHLRHARGRRGQLQLHLAKALVPVQAVQPAVHDFQALLLRDYPALVLTLQFGDSATHRVALRFIG